MPIDLQANFKATLHEMLQAIVAVLAVINPVVCGSIFLTLAPKLEPAQRRRTAVRDLHDPAVVTAASHAWRICALAAN
jgi:small neutral amino acid transporter SnatA (MarC family)